MTDFNELPVYGGAGPYHFNRYRVIFEKPREFSAEALAADFTNNFPHYFTSKFANVEWGKRTFNKKETLKFHGYVRLGPVDAARPHHDWVVREWYDPHVGFTAQTLKRNFFEAGDDLPAAAAGLLPGLAVLPAGPVAAIVAEATIGVAVGGAAVHENRMHFLAGRRSWRLGTGDLFQVPGNVLVLETVAVERFSDQVYNFADHIVHMEKLIPNIWIANLSNFVEYRHFLPMPPERRPGWQTRGMVDYLVKFFPDLGKLEGDRDFQDVLRLYPTILPPKP